MNQSWSHPEPEGKERAVETHAPVCLRQRRRTVAERIKGLVDVRSECSLAFSLGFAALPALLHSLLLLIHLPFFGLRESARGRFAAAERIDSCSWDLERREARRSQQNAWEAVRCGEAIVLRDLLSSRSR